MRESYEYFRITIMEGDGPFRPLRDLCLDDFDEAELDINAEEALIFFSLESAEEFARRFAKEYADLGLNRPKLAIKVVQDGDIVDHMPLRD